MGIKFCDEHEIKSKVVDLIHSLIINIKEKNINNVYDIFRNVYNGLEYPIDEELRSLYLRQKSEIGLLKNNFLLENTDTHIGVDFPSWFNFSDKKDKIMVVGIDPFRDDRFKNGISIGSPFGIHDTHYDILHKVKKKDVYWEFIAGLTEKFSVYVTDTFKVYFRENGNANHRSYNCIRFTNPAVPRWQDEIHQRIFAEEVKIINPKAIITLGIHPVRWFTGCKKENFAQLNQLILKDERLMNNGIPVLPFIHLSGRSTNQAMKLYGVNKENKLGSKYVSIIEDCLNKIIH